MEPLELQFRLAQVESVLASLVTHLGLGEAVAQALRISADDFISLGVQPQWQTLLRRVEDLSQARPPAAPGP